MRRTDSVPQWAYPFAALLLIVACLMVNLLLRGNSAPIESAKTVLKSIPLYPGATQLVYDDTDTPGGKITHQATFCSIECARVTYEAPDRPQQVLRFYEQNAALSKWKFWGDSTFPDIRTYQYGSVEFKGWRLVPELPWLQARYFMRSDYHFDIRTEEKTRGTTGVEIVVRRLARMPSDTPIPTIPPPPPTAEITLPPGAIRTQQPPVPAPVPTRP